MDFVLYGVWSRLKLPYKQIKREKEKLAQQRQESAKTLLTTKHKLLESMESLRVTKKWGKLNKL